MHGAAVQKIGIADFYCRCNSNTKTFAKQKSRANGHVSAHSAPFVAIIAEIMLFVQKAARNFHGKTEKVFWKNGLFIAQMNKL